MKYILITLICVYQRTFSPDHGIIGKIIFSAGVCKFEVTCSEFTKNNINKYGAIKGSFLGLKRFLACI